MSFGSGQNQNLAADFCLRSFISDLDIVIDENSPGLNVPIARWDRVPLSQYHILGMSSREIEAEKRKHDKANAVLRILREAILDSGVAESAEHVVGARVPVLKFLTSLGE